MEPNIITDAVRYGHLLAVAIGLGTAFVADASALSSLREGISSRMLATLHLCHKLIWPALAVMWITGIALIYFRTNFVLDNFTPKLMAKLTVVAVLTINAYLIGKIAMPMMEKNVGRSVASLPMGRQTAAAMISGVSTASWLLALAMGTSKVLAQSGPEVFFVLVPFAYGSALIGGFLAVRFVGRLAPAPIAVAA